LEKLWVWQSWLVGRFYFRETLLMIIIINYTVLKQFWSFEQLGTERVENELSYGLYIFMSKRDCIRYASAKVQEDLDVIEEECLNGWFWKPWERPEVFEDQNNSYMVLLQRAWRTVCDTFFRVDGDWEDEPRFTPVVVEILIKLEIPTIGTIDLQKELIWLMGKNAAIWDRMKERYGIIQGPSLTNGADEFDFCVRKVWFMLIFYRLLCIDIPTDQISIKTDLTLMKGWRVVRYIGFTSL
jgi:hypothetical protein